MGHSPPFVHAKGLDEYLYSKKADHGGADGSRGHPFSKNER